MAQLTGQQRVARGRYVSSCLTLFPLPAALPCSCISSSMRWPLLVSARNLERHQAALARIWRCFYLFSLHFAVVVAAAVARKYLADWHDHAPCKCRTGAACITPTLTAALELHAAAFVVVFVF